MSEKMPSVPEGVKRQLLRQKIEVWRNTVYDAELDVRVADVLGDDRLKEQAAQRLKDAFKALDLLEGMLKEGVDEQARHTLPEDDR